ncbi:MAG: hypothetical protein HRT44_00785 [Bdellovibrionales bacterium]|nr:hypothetical protein [Bdellovibrionales bacterium]NQZ17785.1 hypothetical protein [Bdellovibrionales bacterium]
MKLLTLVALAFLLIPSAQAKVEKQDNSKKMLEKVLAENGIFRCSFTQTINNDLKGEKLKEVVRKNCKKEISKINKWYKKKEFKKRSELLISNGIRSASSHKQTL